MGKAREVLKNFTEFQAYCYILIPNLSLLWFSLVDHACQRKLKEPSTSAVDRDTGAFLLRKLSPSGQHSKASESDAEAADSSSSTYSEVSAACDSEITPGPTKDEQLVNDALLLFLRALLVYQPELKCQWTAHRSPFSTAVFGRNQMNARTDGYLEANGEVFAIIEVKPNIRAPSVRPELLWQETGEMIAWIIVE
ncbi:hypothetical protein N7516_000255 [Penicillium verrucosum]|uniref:uncharacterized protein n=1 Tax=Penicillium verrucosum TaxID=60171 RepID=UPI0025456C4A|nr:uncharacterized protein N7516_000255 [Penicillium verrucosum]KAJ5940087.1 hypothetical protein N7516_000255 [Penicillium verrucosum]